MFAYHMLDVGPIPHDKCVPGYDVGALCEKERIIEVSEHLDENSLDETTDMSREVSA